MNNKGKFEIRLARSNLEKLDIFRFRYEVGVQKYGLKQRFKRDEHQIVIEPLDSSADIFYCYFDNKVIGTSRTNYGTCEHIEFYSRLYDIGEIINNQPDKVIVCSKLLVDQSNDNKRAWFLLRLLLKQYEHALVNKKKLAFLDCEHTSKINTFYQKLGFSLHKKNAQHPDTGTVNVYRLEIDNIKHLNNIKSPFRKIYNKVMGCQ